MPASAPDAGGDQDQPEAQRQRRAEREQLQGQQHHRADHGGEVKAADREQMGEAGAAHRLGVRLGNAALVAGGERGGDRRLRRRGEPRRGYAPARRWRQPAIRARQALLGGRRDDGDVERAAGAADPLEPGGAGEIVGARHGHRRRRHQPGAQADGGARRRGPGRSLSSSTLTRSRARQALADRADDQADGLLGGERLDAFDRRRSNSIIRARSSRGAAARSAFHQIRPQPSAAARRRAASALPQRVPGASGEAAERRGRRRAAGRRSRRAVSGSANQAAMPRISPTGSQSGSWSRSASNRRLEPRGQAREGRTQPAAAPLVAAHPLC